VSAKSLGLRIVGEAVSGPSPFDERSRRRGRAPGDRLGPPAAEGEVHGRADGVVRPRGPLRWLRPVEVGHPVATRAVEPGRQPGGRAREEPCRHPLEPQLRRHALMISPRYDETARRRARLWTILGGTTAAVRINFKRPTLRRSEDDPYEPPRPASYGSTSKDPRSTVPKVIRTTRTPQPGSSVVGVESRLQPAVGDEPHQGDGDIARNREPGVEEGAGDPDHVDRR
jgi:hypothetical protein